MDEITRLRIIRLLEEAGDRANSVTYYDIPTKLKTALKLFIEKQWI